MMGWLQDVSVGDLATWLTVVVAVWYGGKQIKWSREDAREATAIQTWMDYYLHCLAYPQYGCPETLTLDFTKLDKLGSAKEIRESDKYQWFVSFMLLACDLVIRLPKGKGGPNWEQFVRSNVGYHSDYLKSRYFKENYELTLSPELNRKIKEVLRESGEKQIGEGA
jgi:hypothetical protein